LYTIGSYRYSYNIQGLGWGNYDDENRDILLGKIANLVPDTGGPVITYTDQPLYLDQFESQRISFDVVDASGIADVTVYIGSIVATTDDFDLNQYAGFTAFESSPGSYFIDLVASLIQDPMGVQYFVSATDNQGNIGLTNPLLSYMYLSYGEFDGNAISNLSPVQNRSNPLISDYRIFSVNTEGQQFSSVFPFVNNEEIEVYHYEAGATIKLSSFSPILLGRGYWLIFTDEAFVDGNFGGNRPQVNNLNPFVKTLNSGWNQIGNPFPFDIHWGNILDYNVLIGNIPPDHGISGFFSYRGEFNDEGYNIISSTSGGFIRSNEPFTIDFPMPGILGFSLLGSRIARKGQMPLDAEEWKVNIDIENDVTAYRVAAIGMKPNAELDYDKYDIDPLPYMKDYIEFNSITEDNKVVSQSFVPTANGHVWDFEATTSLESMMNKLTWDNSTFGDNDLQLMLYDVAADRIINMREQSEYKFTLNKTHPFKIVFGDENFIKNNLVSAKVSVGKAYPNPFNQSVTLPFTLSESTSGYFVRAEVYNNMGQLVKTMLNQPFKTGFYSVDWDGTNASGQELPGGIYFYRLSVETLGGSEEFNGKIILRN